MEGCRIKLLVSVTNEGEAIEALKGGAHIIDVKNPKEGSLGANFPRIIKRVREMVNGNIEVSATIGDLPNLPGTASLAALGATVSGADYIKAGLFGVKNTSETLYLLKEVCRAVKDFDPSLKVIAGGYADYKSVGCFNPLKLPEIAHAAGADGVIIDVKVKSTMTKIFRLISVTELKKFVDEAHKFNLIVAIAGSLDKSDVSSV
ncbi:MAG: (5-formylfuran-3-yl)methyl phosphate synthase, partial [Fervidobacterium sp.]